MNKRSNQGDQNENKRVVVNCPDRWRNDWIDHLDEIGLLKKREISNIDLLLDYLSDHRNWRVIRCDSEPILFVKNISRLLL